MWSSPAGRGTQMNQDSESRRNQRQRTLKDGKIIFNENRSVINCIVRDVSPTGAKLKLAATTELPTEFKLLLVSENLIAPVACVWRKGDLVGVHFLAEPRTASKMVADARRLKGPAGKGRASREAAHDLGVQRQLESYKCKGDSAN